MPIRPTSNLRPACVPGIAAEGRLLLVSSPALADAPGEGVAVAEEQHGVADVGAVVALASALDAALLARQNDWRGLIGPADVAVAAGDVAVAAGWACLLELWFVLAVVAAGPGLPSAGQQTHVLFTVGFISRAF